MSDTCRGIVLIVYTGKGREVNLAPQRDRCLLRCGILRVKNTETYEQRLRRLVLFIQMICWEEEGRCLKYGEGGVGEGDQLQFGI